MKKANDRLTFFGWIKKYPVKAILLSFIIIIPILLLTLAYVGPTVRDKNFYFNVETTDLGKENEKRTIRNNNDLTSFASITEAKFELTLKPVVTSDTNSEDSLYIVDIKLIEKDSTVSSIKIDSFLRIPKTDKRSKEDTSTTLYSVNTTRTFNYIFNHELPHKSFLFGTYTQPDIFLRIQVTYTDTTKDATIYYVKTNFRNK